MSISEYTDVSNCVVLLKDTQGVYSDAGSTPAVSGNTVQQWNDQSGTGNHATQSTSGLRPTYTTAGSTGGRMSFAGNQMDLPISIDRRSCSILLVLQIRNTATKYLIAANGIGFVLIMDSSGVIKIYHGSFVTATQRVRTCGPVAILVTLGASACKIYVDQTSSPYSTGALASGTQASAKIGANPYPYSNFREIAIWSREINSTEAADVMTLAMSRAGITATASLTGYFIQQGDSITEGNGATLNRNWPTLLGAPPSVGIYNHAVTGRQLQSTLGAQDFDTDPNRASAFLLCYLGTNDISAARTAVQIQNDYTTYCAARVTAGFTKANIVIGTLAMRNNVARDVNTWLRANYASIGGRLADVGADSLIGTETTGTTYGDSSNVHLNDAGYQLMADIFKATVPEIVPPVAGAATEVSHSHNSAVISWTAGTYGIGTITEQLQVNPNGAGWSNVSGVTSSPGTASGLDPVTAYQFRVAYTDSASSPRTVYSNTVSFTTDANPDTTAPVISSASIASNGTDLVVDYTEAGNPPMLPSSGATGMSLVSSTAVSITVSNGTRTGDLQHTFALNRTIYDNETITLSYSEASGNITDQASPVNELPNQSGTAVTNSSSVSPTITSVAVDAIVLVGTADTVTWSSAGIIGNVDILLSLDNGSTFPITIVSGTANDGSYSWTPEAAQITATGVVRVRSSLQTTIYDDQTVIVATTSGGVGGNTALWFRLQELAIEDGLELSRP
jgi:lysophospholipase L1-like esterase